MVMPSVSPGARVSDPTSPALRKSEENPNEGSTAVARVTRGFTVTMKASPPFSTEPAKISVLFGPGRGRPQPAAVRTDASARAAALRVRLMVTARAPFRICLKFCLQP
jgi:hypothetical protein